MRALSLTRISIVDDHHLFAESLDVSLTLQGYQVQRVPPSPPSGALLGRVLRSRPRIVLLDLDLGLQTSGVRLVEPLAAAGIQVVVLTSSSVEAEWGDCLRRGARVVLPKSSQLNGVLGVIRRLAEGKPVLDREERERLVAVFHQDRSRQHAVTSRLEKLSARESQVLGELMAGHQVADIARAFVVSEATVRTQVKSILAKLGVTSQLTAVGLAHESGWTLRSPAPASAAVPARTTGLG